jgi:phage-related protein
VAKGFEIAEGYLDIEADVDGALTDIRKFFKEVDDELTAEEKAFRKSGERSGKNLAEGVGSGASEKIEGTFKKITEKAMTTVEHESSRRGGLLGALVGKGGGGNIGRSLLGGLSNALRSARGLLGRAFSGLGSGLSSIFKGGSKLFSSIATGISEAFRSGLDQAKQLWENASKVFQQASNIGSGIGGVAQFAAMAAAIPLVLGLAGALTHLAAAALALPAAIGVAIAAIAPLIIAFKGFGEAVSAGLSGDVDKFNEALAKLAPNARKVAKEFVGLKRYFSQIKTSVQEAFFGPLVGQISKLGNTLLPVLWVGLSNVAGAWGRVAAGFAQMLGTPQAIGAINNLFMTTARIVDQFGPQLVYVFGALLNLINAGLPYVERFATVVGNGLRNIGDWINKAVAPGGKFVGWMERAWNVGKQLWAVLKGLGEFALTVLNSLGDEGTDTLTGMADAIAKVNEYLKSKEGQETLHNLGVLVHWAGNAFVALLGATVSAYKGLNALFSFVRGIGPFFSGVWDAIVSGAKAVGHWFEWLGSTVMGGLSSGTSAVGGFFQMVWRGIVTAYNAVVGAGAAVVNFIKAVPGYIMAFFGALPGWIASAVARVYDTILYGIGYLGGLLYVFWTQTLPGLVRDGWNWVYAYVSEGASRTWARIQALPGQIWDAIQSVQTLISQAFQTAWNWAYNYVVEGAQRTWDRIRALPGQIWSAIQGIQSMIGNIFRTAWAAASSAVSSGISNVMGFIHGLPGKVQGALSGAGSWLFSAGKNILQGLVNGLEDTLSWAVNKAKDAAKRIKDGFLSALGINSPSKVMRMEVGRWILPGVMQGVEDTKPKFGRYLGATAEMISGGMRPVVNVAAPNVAVGGTTLIADLGDGIRQAVPLQIMRNSATVAQAASVGNRRIAGWADTGRPAVTGAA